MNEWMNGSWTIWNFFSTFNYYYYYFSIVGEKYSVQNQSINAWFLHTYIQMIPKQNKKNDNNKVKVSCVCVCVTSSLNHHYYYYFFLSLNFVILSQRKKKFIINSYFFFSINLFSYCVVHWFNPICKYEGKKKKIFFQIHYLWWRYATGAIYVGHHNYRDKTIWWWWWWCDKSVKWWWSLLISNVFFFYFILLNNNTFIIMSVKHSSFRFTHK